MRVVLVTAPAQAAESLASTLVAERLAACVNLIPGVASVYRWKGVVERSEETLLVLKTTRSGFKRLASRLVELHPYEVPEIVALDVTDAHAPYVAWVRGSIASAPCRKTTKRRQ